MLQALVTDVTGCQSSCMHIYGEITNHITTFTQMFTTTTRYSSQSNDVHPIYLDVCCQRSTFAPVKNLPMNIRVLLFTLLLFGAAGIASAQTTWTGSVSTAWNTAGNWTAGVPDATDDVTIPIGVNNPVISVAGAVAKSVTLQTTLTIDAAGTLTINAATGRGIDNQGTVQNNGTITIGNTGSGGTYGIYNSGSFNNNTGAQIYIDQVSSTGIYNYNGVSFTNRGTITIGSLSSGNSFDYGIYITNPFINDGGQINIDRVTFAILANGATFNNAGTITAKPAASVPSIFNAFNNGLFSNNTGGKIIGTGWIAPGAFENAGGTLTPGTPIGTMNFSGDENFSHNTLEIEVNGTGAAGTNYDQVEVRGTATLGGTLAVTINYTATVGDEITILSPYTTAGVFDNVTGLPANWHINYKPTGVTLSYGFAYETIWTGAVNTDWNNAGNWTGGVPTATMDVTIPNVTNDPLLNTATGVAKTILVQSGGNLTIGAAGTLAINNSTVQGILNQGTVQNNGTINIGGTAAVGQFGINNEGTFNNTAGQINIDRTTDIALYNHFGTFINTTGISIGATTAVGYYGIRNDGSFTNTGGQIKIDRADFSALNNTGTFANSGNITIGATAAAGEDGIRNSGVFNNNTAGQINIDRVNMAVTADATTLNNAGVFTIGAAAGVGYLLNSLSGGSFSNNTGGLFKGTGSIPAAYFINAGGTLAPGASIGTMTFNASKDLNNSYLNIEVNGTGAAGTIYDQLVVNGTATLGGTLVVAINYTPTAGDQITILRGTTVAGTFATVTGLPANWYVSYTTTAVILSYGFQSSTTWTGAVNTDWNTAGNWTGGVPGAVMEVFIPDVTNDPLLNTVTGLAKTITIESGAVLTIGAAGTLAINNSAVQGMLNKGTIQNNGAITIGATGGAGQYGINNLAAFNNNAGAQLIIDQVTTSGLVSDVGSTFTNAGVITIGATAAVGQYGLYNAGTFSNTGGQIKIDNVTETSILNTTTFTNTGSITIGANTASGQYGINNTAAFNNNTGGQINIDRITDMAIYHNGTGFTNQGTITIGSLSGGNTINYGFYTDKNFSNAGGQINIDRVNTAFLTSANTFDNSGTITMGATTSVSFLLSHLNNGTFSNNTGGVFKGAGAIGAARFVNAGGTLAPGTPIGTMNFDGNEDFSNSTLNIEVNGTGNFDKVVVNGTATLGGTLVMAINYTPTAGDQLTVFSATAISGTFTTVTSLPANWYVNYTPTAVILTYGSPLITVWTGAISTSWNTAGNWTNGVPAATIEAIIPDVTNDPLLNTATGLAKTITIQNGGSLTIGAAGTLTINNSAVQGILNQGAIQNNGTISIGGTAPSGQYGINNTASFNNNAGAQINIDRVTATAIYNNSGTFNNAGAITIGANAATGVNGVDNYSVFNNYTGGQINIDRVNAAITVSSNTFDNAGTIIIGAVTSVATLLNTTGTGTFNNNTGGILKGTGSIAAARFANAGGSLTPGVIIGTMTFNAAESFSNSTLNIEVNGASVAGTDYDQLKVTGTATLGGTLAVAINYTPANGDIIPVLTATSISGTFGTVTGLPANWNVNYSATEVTLSYGILSGTTTWTGNLSTDWNSSGNWTAGIPTATQEVVIPDVTNDPILNTATGLAKTITIQSNGSLTIDAAGTLTINNSAVQGIYNQGTVQNNGTITIGSTATVGMYGIYNSGTFSNTGSGHINIDQATNYALWNWNNKTFTNAGSITIGANAASGQYGIYNRGTFNNNTGGLISIDRTTTSSLYNLTAVNFTNYATITIGANAAAGTNGIENYGTFQNQAGAQVTIDRVTIAGIYNGNAFTAFNNLGTIIIGSLSAGNTINYGIYIDFNFSNAGGQINIDRVTNAIAVNAATLTNTGIVTIGKLVPVTTLLAATATGSFSNNTGGEVKGTGTIDAARFVNNGGKLSPGYSPGKLTFTGNETFTNSTMNIELAGTAVAGTDYDQVVVNGTATLGGNLTVTAINGFTIAAGQSFVILTGTSVTGTFASVSLPAGVTGTVTYSATAATLNILTALPLTLVEFSGEAKGDKAVLKWKTADEENTSVFEVERSADGVSYTKVGTVATMGTGAHSYSFTDENPAAGNNYYRLKMVDKDGKFTYSKSELVKIAAKGGIQIAPSPANSFVKLTVQNQSLIGQRAQVYNTAGILVANVVLTSSTQINISNWPNGIYNIKTIAGTYRFIKQ